MIIVRAVEGGKRRSLNYAAVVSYYLGGSIQKRILDGKEDAVTIVLAISKCGQGLERKYLNIVLFGNKLIKGNCPQVGRYII